MRAFPLAIRPAEIAIRPAEIAVEGARRHPARGDRVSLGGGCDSLRPRILGGLGAGARQSHGRDSVAAHPAHSPVWAGRPGRGAGAPGSQAPDSPRRGARPAAGGFTGIIAGLAPGPGSGRIGRRGADGGGVRLEPLIPPSPAAAAAAAQPPPPFLLSSPRASAALGLRTRTRNSVILVV